MKKAAIFIFLNLSFATPIFADMVIFNMSRVYDANITYRKCYYPDNTNHFFCGDEENTTIKSKKSENEKNYALITSPSKPWPLLNASSVTFQIISVTEKDEHGNIVAYSKYFNFNPQVPVNSGSGACKGSIGVSDPNTYNTFIVLNDMNESPYITCNVGTLGIN